MTVLDRTWKNCLSMWKWMVEQIDRGVAWDIYSLKSHFMDSHRFTKPVVENCFFCQYDEDHLTDDEKNKERTCSKCPGRLVDRRFYCSKRKYNYYDKPRLFYQELLRLNALRQVTPKHKKKK